MKTSHGYKPLERDIQRSMLQWLRSRPRSFTVKLAAGPFSTPGLPDILHIEAGHAIFIEVKRTGGSLTPLQKSVFAMLLKAGATCIVASSLELLREMMDLKPSRKEKQE